MQLPLSSCHGQTYDGASHMLSKKSGVAAKILNEVPKALPTHCHVHSLGLSNKSTCQNAKILNDVMGTVGEICVLVKYSLKRENMLGEIKSNVDADIDEEALNYGGPSLDKLCITRWTIRGRCFEKVQMNYIDLMKLWDECLQEGRLNTEVKARIMGCKKQMSTFHFFFGLCFGQRLYSITDNFSKALQSEKLSAVSSQNMASLTLKTLQNMRTQEDFELFLNLVTKQAEKLPVDEANLKRKRKVPKYSILQYLDGQETTSEAHYPANVEDEFHQFYFDALDHITNVIEERFDQPSFKAYANLEELLVKGAINQTSEVGINQIKSPYSDEVDVSDLEVEFKVFKQMFEDPPECLNNVVEMFKRQDKSKELLVPNIVTICKLLLVNPATSANTRALIFIFNIKTWKCSTTKAKRFNALSILYIYKELTDKIDLVEIGNVFAEKHENRKSIFGKFSHDDFKV